MSDLTLKQYQQNIALLGQETVNAEFFNRETPVELVNEERDLILVVSGAIVQTPTVLFTGVAGEVLSALRVVKGSSNGRLWYCSSVVVGDSGLVIGITTTSASAAGATVSYMKDGEMTDSSWNWDTTKPIYCGTDGALTQTVPTSGFRQVVAVPLSPTKISIQIKEPIILL